MKQVFTITTSNDGLANAAFTNIKALYEFLMNELCIGNSKVAINDKEVAFSYNTLVKAIRDNQSKNRFFVAHIYSDLLDTVTINELGLISK